MNIDYTRLKKDLIDYFGTAIPVGFPMAIADISNIECATNEELIEIAKDSGFNINNYVIEEYDYKKIKGLYK